MSGIPVARLFGFEIRIHISWAIILAVVVVVAATQLETLEPGAPTPARWLVGGIVAAAFLASALVHELAHAIVARRSGVETGPIVVYFFGGSVPLGQDVGSPRTEITAGLAGPVVSLLVGVVLAAIGLPGAIAGGGVVAVAGQIALIVGALNLLLGGLNLVPAFPLDGGRVAHGIAWRATGDSRRATRLVARLGRLLGWALGVAGFASILVLSSIDNGLMLAICGWFLVSTARQTDRIAMLDELLDGLSVGEVMERDVEAVPPGLTVDTFAGRMLDGTSGPSLPVMQNQTLLGVISAGQLRRLRRDRWPTMRAEDVMVAESALPALGPETTLRSGFDDLRRSGLEGLPVFDAGGLIGILTRRGVARAVQSRAEGRGVPLP
ncbi:MAG: site-2 protease family protein [Chloroflexota bacterium]